MTEAFCVRCRKKVEIKNEKTVKYKNGRYAVTGLCPECDTKVFRTIKKRGLF
jgi:DNA-directed RNA polymerase subunit RPC12/RpoP